MKVRDGQAIRRCRLMKHYTQRDMASLCNCSQNAIHLIESGKMTTLSESLAIEIARRLEVPWENLFEPREAATTPAVTTGARTTRRRVAA